MPRRKEFDDLWGTNNPDLRPYKESGGKLLALHGWADSSVTANGAPLYWERVKKILGGEEAVDDVYRLFMIPGFDHCADGIIPDRQILNLLVDWVVNGTAPETIPKVINGMSRDVCKHPRRLQYRGEGDIDGASAWECV
ncbi:putative esterase [Paramyrothecium foliicola]|nr:putative esterase [Paramyrothecium foliicola]